MAGCQGVVQTVFNATSLDQCVSLTAKLQLKAGPTMCVVGAPQDADLDDVQTDEQAPAILVFVRTKADLGSARPALDAARADGIAWIAYPKANQLGTDLNRDLLWAALENEGVRPVRQISIDAVWSALRFRPA